MDRDLVIRFHALKAPTVKVKVVPWHPKNNMRSDRPYDLLFQLAHCGPWMVLGCHDETRHTGIITFGNGDSGYNGEIQRSEQEQNAKPTHQTKVLTDAEVLTVPMDFAVFVFSMTEIGAMQTVHFTTRGGHF